MLQQLFQGNAVNFLQSCFSFPFRLFWWLKGSIQLDQSPESDVGMRKWAWNVFGSLVSNDDLLHLLSIESRSRVELVSTRWRKKDLKSTSFAQRLS